MKMRLLLFVIIFFSISSVQAQFTWLDQTWGSGGMITNRLDTSSRVVSILVQPDNKVLVLCNYSFADVFGRVDSVILYRFEPNGAPDISFGHMGAVHVHAEYADQGANILLQADNKILVTDCYAGFMFDNALVRLNADGSLDHSFGTNGIAYQNSQMVVSRGTIRLDNSQYLLNSIVANNPLARSILVWFDTAGNVLRSFPIALHDTIGLAFLIVDMLEQPDHTLLAAGAVWSPNLGCKYSALARMHPNGELDTTFGTKGIAYLTSRPIDASSYYLINSASSIAVQSDAKILVAGYLTKGYQEDSLFAARYDQTGQLDQTFGDHGIFTFPMAKESEVEKMVLQADGKILLTGMIDSAYTETPFLIRLDMDGRFDTSFAAGGFLPVVLGGRGGRYSAMALQNDGRIVTGGFEFGTDGNIHILIARYLPSRNIGIIDFALDNNSTYIYPNPIRSTEKLHYTLKESGLITVALQDISGRELQTLMRDEQSSGEHALDIILPQDLPAGPYMISISSPAGKTGVRVTKE